MIFHEAETWALIRGDCLRALRDLEDNSIDAGVTDPPYELGFMGKGWDRTGIANSPELWAEVLRVLKPGGHLLAFGGTRTAHRMTCAIEDAGFEIRDSLDWIYGTGFPKSLNVSKAIDDSLGVEQPAYPEGTAAQRWEGWGTALKPGHEPIVLARKPLVGTVAQNVLAHGTGGLNIDGCRIGPHAGQPCGFTETTSARWPANVLFDEEAAAELDAQNGGASRFFYVSKPSRKERDLGCAHLPAKSGGEATDREDGSAGVDNPRAGAGRTGGRAKCEELFAEVVWQGEVQKARLLVDTETSPPRVTGVSGALKMDASGWSTMLFGSVNTAPSLPATTSTIATRISSTTGSKIWNLFRGWFTSAHTVTAPSDPTETGISPVESADESGLLLTIADAKTASLLGVAPAASPTLLRIRGSGRLVGAGIRNGHPTVKPVELMRYLVRLITPPGGIVLDPFTGSGTTGMAARMEGFGFLGIEREPEYFEIAKARISAAEGCGQISDSSEAA